MVIMEREKTVAEFINGPRDGATIAHEYDAMPKFVLVDEEGTLIPLPDSVIRMYILTNDGKYHYTEID